MFVRHRGGHDQRGSEMRGVRHEAEVDEQSIGDRVARGDE